MEGAAGEVRAVSMYSSRPWTLSRTILPVFLMLAGLVGCSDSNGYTPLAIPDRPNSASTSSTTAVPNYEAVELARASGTTTTAVPLLSPGTASLRGVVIGPSGPVPGATVRLERYVGELAASGIVTTGSDGSWEATNIKGGRYRVRAWLAPDLVQADAQIMFVPSNGEALDPLSLRVQSVAQPGVEIAVAPNPPVVGQPINLLVRLTSRQVDSDGFVRQTPQVGVSLRLVTTGRWTVQSGTTAADSAGRMTYRLVCNAAGSQGLSGVLNDTTFALAVPDCVNSTPSASTSISPSASTPA